MEPKTIVVLITGFVVVILFGKPLGQIAVDLGNVLITIGNDLQHVGH